MSQPRPGDPPEVAAPEVSTPEVAAPEIATTAEALEAAAMPPAFRARAHAVHADPEERGAEDGPMPTKLPPPKSAAEWAYRRLILYIARFEEALDAEHEVAMGFTDGGTGVIRIEGMGHFDPDMVTFYGTDPRGAKVQLIQHVTQLSVLLRAVPKRRPKEAPRRIGFRLRADLEGEGSERGEEGPPGPAERPGGPGIAGT